MLAAISPPTLHSRQSVDCASSSSSLISCVPSPKRIPAPCFHARHHGRKCPYRLQVASLSSDGQDSSTGARKARLFSVPMTVDESIEQAVYACKQAKTDGLRRLQLEILLPLIGATDLDDWPGGIQQQFKAATPIVSKLLKGVADFEGQMGQEDIKPYIIDDGDAVAVWKSEKAALVLFPNAECLEEVMDLESTKDRPLMLVNAQWQGGQIISDFGFGEQRRKREEFVGSFSVVYHLKQLRIMGEDVRLLKCYPGDWQVFVMDSSGGSECIAVEENKPSYAQIQDILRGRSGSKASQGWFARLVGEFKFNQDSLKND